LPSICPGQRSGNSGTYRRGSRNNATSKHSMRPISAPIWQSPYVTPRLQNAELPFYKRHRGTEAKRTIETRSILPMAELFLASLHASSPISRQFSKPLIAWSVPTLRSGWGAKSGMHFLEIWKTSGPFRFRLRSFGRKVNSSDHDRRERVSTQYQGVHAPYGFTQMRTVQDHPAQGPFADRAGPVRIPI